MSEPTLSDDELISSYIDGEATLDEVARVQADPELLARVPEFENAAELLSTPVPPLPGNDVDRLINTALAESTTSDRIIDLSAVRARLTFHPQQLAAIAATFVLLAGVVGILFALNNSDSGDMAASETASDYFDEGDDMADDGDDMAFDADVAESFEEPADFDDDMAAEYFEDDGDDGDDTAEAMTESGDMAESDDTVTSGDSAEASTTTEAAAVGAMTFRLLSLEIAGSYENTGELIAHATEQWRELVDAGATAVPQVIEEQGIAEQALADVPCGQELRAFIDTLDHSAGSGGISVGETTIGDTPLTILVVELSINTAELLTAAEPTCTITQPATLSP